MPLPFKCWDKRGLCHHTQPGFLVFVTVSCCLTLVGLELKDSPAFRVLVLKLCTFMLFYLTTSMFLNFCEVECTPLIPAAGPVLSRAVPGQPGPHRETPSQRINNNNNNNPWKWLFSHHRPHCWQAARGSLSPLPVLGNLVPQPAVQTQVCCMCKIHTRGVRLSIKI